MSWVRLLIIALLLIISLFAESFIQENASHVYNATIPSLINCALLLMGCILVILSDLEGGGRNKKGLRLLSLLIVFLIGVNFLSSIIRAPTNYEILTSIDKTKFASVDVSSNGLMVLSGTIGGPTTKSLVKSIESTSRNILIINSKGGAIEDAIEIARLVKEKDIIVVVENECSSACVIVASSSKQLMAMSDAKFGFHQASIFGRSNSQHSQYWAKNATNTLISELEKSGIPKNILKIAEKTPPNESPLKYS